MLKNDVNALLTKTADRKADCIVSLTPVKEPQRYKIAELSMNWKRVLWTVEKPKEPKSNPAVIGVYAFKSTFFELYTKLKPSRRDEMDITDAISLLIDAGFKVIPHHVESWWKDTGKPGNIFAANCQKWGGMSHHLHARDGSLSV